MLSPLSPMKVSNSGKVLDEVTKMAYGVQKPVGCLRETTKTPVGLKSSVRPSSDVFSLSSDELSR
jgi:hypothetical protein